MKTFVWSLVLAAGVSSVLCAQQHLSVPLDDEIYYILEQAQLRGICEPLPAVKPYTRIQVVRAIDEILAWDESQLEFPTKAFLKLSVQERKILDAARRRYTGAETKEGFSLARGAHHYEKRTEKNGYRLSADVGFGVESVQSFSTGEGSNFGTDNWFSSFLAGDLGEHVSYDFTFSFGVMKASRGEKKEGWAYYYEQNPELNGGDPDRPYNPPPWSAEPGRDAVKYNIQHPVSVYKQPEAFFPYTYRRKWDGIIFNFGQEVSASGMTNWPENSSTGTSILSEIAGDAFDGILSYRFGRIRREWASITGGSSLVFNGFARPFVAFEMTYRPVSWFSFSSLTGGLEYYNENGITGSSWNFQNLFSIEQFELNYKNYVHFVIGSVALYPKRFEPGYIFPLQYNFLYQNNVGDFDNMAMYFNLALQYPGIGGIWFSAFADEVEVSSVMKAFALDRNMFALQAGAKILVPQLPFTTIIMSYTKIEPYCYTHTRNYVPWYNSGGTEGNENLPMDVSYTNNGVGIGYYLPPNSDEFKIRLETRPFVNLAFSLQYQLIRHGAEYGSGEVDGSSYQSELWSNNRADIEKNFLNDGAYEWTHVGRLGVSYSFLNIPLKVYAEIGAVKTNFENPRGSTADYQDSFRFIATLGLRYFIK